MPETISPEKIELMKTFGATVMLQPAVPFADPRHYYHTADKIARETPG
jgi:cysteine synthase A